MKIHIDISDEEIEQIIKNAIQEKVNEWMKEALSYRSEFRRHFDKEYKEAVKELIYDPEQKQKIIDSAVKEAAYELKRKGMPKLLEQIRK